MTLSMVQSSPYNLKHLHFAEQYKNIASIKMDKQVLTKQLNPFKKLADFFIKIFKGEGHTYAHELEQIQHELLYRSGGSQRTQNEILNGLALTLHTVKAREEISQKDFASFLEKITIDLKDGQICFSGEPVFKKTRDPNQVKPREFNPSEDISSPFVSPAKKENNREIVSFQARSFAFIDELGDLLEKGTDISAITENYASNPEGLARLSATAKAVYQLQQNDDIQLDISEWQQQTLKNIAAISDSMQTAQPSPSATVMSTSSLVSPTCLPVAKTSSTIPDSAQPQPLAPPPPPPPAAPPGPGLGSSTSKSKSRTTEANHQSTAKKPAGDPRQALLASLNTGSPEKAKSRLRKTTTDQTGTDNTKSTPSKSPKASSSTSIMDALAKSSLFNRGKTDKPTPPVKPATGEWGEEAQ